MLNYLYEYVYLYNCILPVRDGSRSPMVRVWGKKFSCGGEWVCGWVNFTGNGFGAAS
jgi:hypothetical protein